MKKIITVLSIALLGLNTMFAKDTVPEFKNPDAFIIDMSQIPDSKRFEDNIIIVDKYSEEQMSVIVHVYDGKEWVEAGTASLNRFDAMQAIKPRKIKFEGKKYFAIEPNDDNIYICSVYVQNDDLYVEVRDQNSDLKMAAAPAFSYSENAFFLQRKLIRGKFDENMKFRNRTEDKRVVFSVYAYHPRSRSWIPYGTAKTGGKNSLAKVSTRLDLGDYEYFAFYPSNEKEYKYTAMADDDDLIITISE